MRRKTYVRLVLLFGILSFICLIAMPNPAFKGDQKAFMLVVLISKALGVIFFLIGYYIYLTYKKKFK